MIRTSWNNDGDMSRHSVSLSFLILILTLSCVLGASEPGNITITEFELKNYVRHPRMEEADRLKGGNPAYRPGLEIITDIDDVEIRFFEEKVGRTPAEWDGLKAGSYRVQLERTGYELIEFQVILRSDRRSVVYVTMIESLGRLRVANLPEGARVFVDRIPKEGNEFPIPAGSRSLKVTSFGWDPVQEIIEIIAGETLEWTYKGIRCGFSLGALKIRPESLPSGDRRGFRIDWSASAAGHAEIRIINPFGRLEGIIPIDVSSSTGYVYWVPENRSGLEVEEGNYRVSITGTGDENQHDEGESELRIDNRFKREARPSDHLLPGLLYAPGAAMLPPGTWQASTAITYDIGTGPGGEFDGVPVSAGLRTSPAERWEISGKFGIRARDPFDATSLILSLSGSWRMNPDSGIFSSNLALLYLHEGYSVDFGGIPSDRAGMRLPGLQLSLPMELSFGRFSAMLSPSAHLVFLGENPESWNLDAPARFAGTLSAGAYYETGGFLFGGSMALRSPDVSGTFLDWTLWSGIEGRFDLPGDFSYLAAWCGVRSLDADPVVSLGMEFGVIR